MVVYVDKRRWLKGRFLALTESRITILLVTLAALIAAMASGISAAQVRVGEEARVEGLTGAWYGRIDYQRIKGQEQLDTLNQDWSRLQNTMAGRGKVWSGQWEGYITAPITGEIDIHVASDYLAAVTVQKKRIITSEGIEGSGSIVLEKDRHYPIKIRYAHRQGDSFLRVMWSWNGHAKSQISRNYLTHSPAQDDKWKRRLQNPSGQRGSITNRALPQPLTDWSMWPQAYGVLMNEKAMFPVDLTFWKARIDSSRQLFVDNHLLAGMDNIEREFHQVKKHPANPILEDYTHGGYVWPDPGGGYRLYYNQYQLIEGGNIVQAIRLARSDDGIHWEKLDLNSPEIADEPQQGTIRVFSREHVGDRNNVLIPHALLHGLFHEPDCPDPDERWKAVARDYSVGYVRWAAPFLQTRDFSYKGGGLEAPVRHDEDQTSVKVFGINKLYTSPDGLHWTAKEEILPQLFSARFVLDLPAGGNFPLGIGAALRTRWDPYLKKYIAHTKHVIGPDWRFNPVLKGRAQGWSESDDLVHWSSPRIFVYPDAEDAKIPGMYGIYESDGFRYESMWLGCLSMIAYIPQRAGGQPEKEHWIRLAGSRDGRHWYYLGDREPFIPAGEDGDWDTHYMRMVNLATTGGPVEMGDDLWFYYWGRDQGESFPEHRLHLGIGTLRKDGFASLNAGEQPGAVATRPLIFDGAGRLFVNAQTSPEGYVKAAVLDEYGNDIDSFTVHECHAVQGDHIQAPLSWEFRKTLAALKDRHVRIVFHLKGAKLYSFWIE